MDAALFWALASVIANVVLLSWNAWITRQAESSDTRKAVNELAESVEHFTRLAKREQMRRVRASTASPQEGMAGADAPPELRQAATQPLTKDDLRRMLIRRA